MIFVKPLVAVAAIAAGACLGASSAQAQWTVTNLHPAGATWSRALGGSGDQQAGYARIGGVDRAGLWSGTAASWVDLHAFLPSEFSSSEARAISTDGINVYVSGFGYDSVEEREEALLSTVPETDASALAGMGGLVGLALLRAKSARAVGSGTLRSSSRRARSG